MLEIKITVECPDLLRAAALVADALTTKQGGRLEALAADDAGTTAGDTETAAANPAPAGAPQRASAPTPIAPCQTVAPSGATAANSTPALAQPAVPTTAVPLASNPTPAPAPVNTAPAVPLAAVPEYTHEQLARAGAAFVSQGPDKAKAAMALLQQFGVVSVSALPKDKYGEFATALRGLGAAI